MTTMLLDPKIISTKFTVGIDTTKEYVCVGYAQNSTFVVFGALNDTVNTSFKIESFKLTEVTFIGKT
jgi:hypothetical protein